MPSPPEPWTRNARIALVVLAALVTIGLVLLHHPWYERSETAAWTLAEARRMATGVSLLPRPADGVPGLATLLAPFAGGERLDLGRIHLALSCAGSLTVVLLFVFQRPRLGGTAAALGALAVAASPAFLRSCNRISDVVPGTAAFLGCLLVERWSARRPSAVNSFGSGLALGIADWVSPGNLVLLPAVLLARTFGRTGGRAGAAHGVRWRIALREHVPIALGAIVGLVPFTVFHRPPALWPAGERGSLELARLAALLGSGSASDEPTWIGAAWAVGIVGGLVLAIVRRREAGELAALGIAGLALAPASESTPEALLPVLALGLPALLAALRDGSGRYLGRRAGTLLACVVAATWIAARFDPNRGRRELRAGHESLVEFAEQVGARLPADARVASGLGLHLALFLDRPVIRLDVCLDPADQDALEAWIDRERVDTLVLYPRLPSDLKLVPYVLLRYGERDPERVVTIAPGYLARVRP